ncbi:hypothetical protein [Pseudovibrio sp. Alg231-02]|uniref:hypothetical protein n=1 Tax=Pseudovibrio sp. Alg231-02 TaxID=1922223 RepID=UPI000D54FC72|nr:hypothetical protein [Pseudovibrio sp. Alg231-02]
MKVNNSTMLPILLCAALTGCQTLDTQPGGRIVSNSQELSKLERAIEKYKHYEHRKAFATVIGKNGAWSYGYNKNNTTRERAVRDALRRCEIGRKKQNIKKKCTIYMEGNRVLRDL